ncbi:3-hydroxyacyl-CoA dehydrogenase NAD-binding domain-containing protein [Streptomyces sp. NPDC051677]|uniref:3-hydroxyacyl-CoA dehydrogenase NAD-binding domain-containing protein n=1 Tax=Streptomyces sp. NPDC051677 TaxID=3365669 RepID=UPI0037D28530
MSFTEGFHHLSPTVRYGVQDGVAVILLANPPVNGLGDTIRAGIEVGVARARQDDTVKAVIIVGDGRGFCGGADIRQFNTPAGSAEPTIGTVWDSIQQLRKPVIASISGFALGGGLELALVCHYRIADGNARLGLPEVGLGLIPGAGGTQRLPRLIGTREALAMIQHGTTVSGRRAAELGIIDSVFAGDPIEAGLSFARKVIADGGATQVVDHLPTPDPEGFDFAAARKGIASNARNGLAQRVAIDCVEAATSVPVQEGLAVEGNAFNQLLEGSESKALRHVFFAEKAAAKVADVPADTPVRAVEHVAVIGAGTMGAGIAMAFANARFPVTLIEQNQAALNRGLDAIRRNYEATAAKGKLTADQVAERLGRINPTLDLAAAADADLVIEAVFEDIDVKKELFGRIDKVCRQGAILASNTSRLDVDEISRATTRPADVIGLHFFSPANVMKLLEVIRGDATSGDVIATSMRIAQRIGKIPVLARICDGFIGNRMIAPYLREADFLLEEGATPQQIDRALGDFGLAMGPLAMSDLAGLDIRLATQRLSNLPKHLRYSAMVDQLCEAGRFGQKSGAGYYRYDKGSRTPIPDPFIDQVIEQRAADAGIERRTISDQEILDRCIFALVNEGARLLEEGIAQRASDIDVVYVNGYGFPAYRGGPMYYAQDIGLDVTLRKIQKLHEAHGEFWSPAPLLERLVSAGETAF